MATRDVTVDGEENWSFIDNQKGHRNPGLFDDPGPIDDFMDDPDCRRNVRESNDDYRNAYRVGDQLNQPPKGRSEDYC